LVSFEAILAAVGQDLPERVRMVDLVGMPAPLPIFICGVKVGKARIRV